MYNVTIDLPDLVVGDTTIKCKATVISLEYNLQAQEVKLTWEKRFYASLAGECGEPMPNMMGVTYTNRAGMDTYINMQGDNVEDAFDIIPPTFDEDGGCITPQTQVLKDGLMPSFIFFNYLAENTSVNLHSLFTKYGTRDSSKM